MTRNTLLPILFATLIGGLYFGSMYVSKIICPPGVQASAAAAVTTKLTGWNIADSKDFSVNSASTFGFINSTFDHITPRSSSLQSLVEKTATYLKSNPSRSLNITGYYSQDESNESVYPNLGFARANNVKELVASLGVPNSQIATKGELVDANSFNINKLEKGVEFSFSGIVTENTNERLDEIKNRLFGKPISLYFETGENDLNLTDQQRQDFADLKYYLDNVSSSSLSINGHTDALGNSEKNMRLSQERSQEIKNYLIKNGGITMNRMTTIGYGETQPIGDNNRTAGRAKNRRVEVILE